MSACHSEKGNNAIDLKLNKTSFVVFLYGQYRHSDRKSSHNQIFLEHRSSKTKLKISCGWVLPLSSFSGY